MLFLERKEKEIEWEYRAEELYSLRSCLKILDEVHGVNGYHHLGRQLWFHSSRLRGGLVTGLAL